MNTLVEYMDWIANGCPWLPEDKSVSYSHYILSSTYTAVHTGKTLPFSENKVREAYNDVYIDTDGFSGRIRDKTRAEVLRMKPIYMAYLNKSKL